MRQSFTERMQEARDSRMADRNKGYHTGKMAAGWKKNPRDRLPMSALDKLYMETYRLESAFAHYHEWQYQALAAVESALFASDLENVTFDLGETF